MENLGMVRENLCLTHRIHNKVWAVEVCKEGGHQREDSSGKRQTPVRYRLIQVRDRTLVFHHRKTRVHRLS